MADLVRDVLTTLGYPGIAALVAIETIIPPIPSEVILPLAGWLVDRGEMQFLAAVLAATIGSVAGAVALYELARHGGRAAVLRLHALLRVDEDDLERLERRFERRGVLYVAGGRLIPGIRGAVSVPAGLTRMPRLRFAALTTAGSAVWNTALVGAGWALGSQYERVSEVIGPVGTVVLVLAVAGAVLWLVRRRRRSAAAPRASGARADR